MPCVSGFTLLCVWRVRSARRIVPENHPILQVASNLGIECFGSPTLSDQALIPYPSVKIGPGDSARSHTADEYVGVEEIRQGIEGYIRILEKYMEIAAGDSSKNKKST